MSIKSILLSAASLFVMLFTISCGKKEIPEEERFAHGLAERMTALEKAIVQAETHPSKTARSPTKQISCTRDGGLAVRELGDDEIHYPLLINSGLKEVLDFVTRPEPYFCPSSAQYTEKWVAHVEQVYVEHKRTIAKALESLKTTYNKNPEAYKFEVTGFERILYNGQLGLGSVQGIVLDNDGNLLFREGQDTAISITANLDKLNIREELAKLKNFFGPGQTGGQGQAGSRGHSRFHRREAFPPINLTPVTWSSEEASAQ